MKIFHLPLLVCLLIVSVLSNTAAAQVTRVVDDDGQGTGVDCNAATPALTRVGDAIAASASGDTVLVCPGIYIENIGFGGKGITVRSIAGPQTTILDGNAADAVVRFTFNETAAAVLEGFTIRNGFSSDLGGGGILISQASPVIRGNLILSNRACAGSGIISHFGSPLIEGNTIAGNTQGGCSGGTGGGGIGIIGQSSATIRGNTIRDNVSGGDGGGISLFAAGTPTIERNIITGNRAGEGGGISMVNKSDATIAGNLIAGNRASSKGGGVYWLVPLGDRGAIVVNNTIAANDSPSGSGVFADGFDRTAVLYNNIIVAAPAQTAVFCGNFNDLNPPVFRFNDVYSATGASYGGICADQTGVLNNISADPLFVNAATGDYRLRGTSPAIDAAERLFPGVPAIDLDGHPRLIDGNGDGLAIVDMGAYEALPPVRHVQIDRPAPGNVGVAFVVSGWAVDGRGVDTGVDAVHVWAFPETGGAPTFLGAAEYGLSRPDILVAQIEPRYTNSGFQLTAPPVLGVGNYVLVALARSTVTGTFDVSASIRVTVPSLPLMAVDRPVDGATVWTSFDLSGWALDYASPDGPGVDAVHVYAFPAAGGGPVFLGAATYGLARPDVGAFFGSPKFAASGWALRAALPPGDYQIGVYARDTITQAFNGVLVRALKVVESRALIAIDRPSPGAVVGQPFTISGWAVDLASVSGPGVYTVHAYAFPSSGGSPIFLGAAIYGAARPDVGAAFGARFTNSGYTIAATGLPPGTYLIAALPGSYVANDFTAVQTVTITVAPAGKPER